MNSSYVVASAIDMLPFDYYLDRRPSVGGKCRGVVVFAGNTVSRKKTTNNGALAHFLNS